MGKNSKDSNETIVETAKKNFNFAVDADSENRALAIEDMEFRAGDQWPEAIKQERVRDCRPCLTVNKIPQNIHQITNDQRQNRPMIKVSPYDDGADPETAKVLQGIIRNIEVNSNADTAYDCAFESAVTGGRGFFRIVTDYCDPHSFNQDIKILTISDPHTVLLDPNYKEPDGSDANWGFFFDDIPLNEFKAQYPDAEVSTDGFDIGELGENWHDGEKVRVAEYFDKTFKKETLVQLPDGSTSLKSDIEQADPVWLDEQGLTPEVLEALYEEEGKTRETQVPVINWYKINGQEILEQTEWAGQYIPIIPVHGETLIVKGKRVFEGIVRHAKDPQRMYNFWATAEAEAIALAPKAPFIGAEGQFKGHENEWKQANIKNFPYLQYKPTTLGGVPMPPPQRVNSNANVSAINQARMLSSDDLKSSTGIYDASLGNRSNESSGIAINRRAQQSQTGNFHFVDNLSRSIRHAGRIILELIPKIYDTERVVRIIGADDEEEIIAVNTLFKDKDKLKQYGFETGKYDVSVDTGPSYASKRQEAVDSMLKLIQSYPKAAEIAGDLMVGNMDWPGAKEIAERLKRTLPPAVIGEEEEIPAAAKAQIEQMGQQLEAISQALEEKAAELDDKKLELESKERIEFAKLETQIKLKMAELEVKELATPRQMYPLEAEANELEHLQGNPSQIQNDLPPINPAQTEGQYLTSEMPLGTTPEMNPREE